MLPAFSSTCEEFAGAMKMHVVGFGLVNVPGICGLRPTLFLKRSKTATYEQKEYYGSRAFGLRLNVTFRVRVRSLCCRVRV